MDSWSRWLVLSLFLERQLKPLLDLALNQFFLNLSCSHLLLLAGALGGLSPLTVLPLPPGAVLCFAASALCPFLADPLFLGVAPCSFGHLTGHRRVGILASLHRFVIDLGSATAVPPAGRRDNPTGAPIDAALSSSSVTISQ